MPRKRIYHTKAELRAANQAKSNRYYHKNKLEIQARRRQVYTSQNTITTPQEHLNDNEMAASNSASQNVLESNTARYIRLAEQMGSKVETFIKFSPYKFVDTIYHNYVQSCNSSDVGNMHIIQAPTKQLMRWQRCLLRCFEAISQDPGVGGDLGRIQAHHQMAGRVVDDLQQLLCEVMVEDSVSALQAAHGVGKLSYQQK
ncbi:hypothetical protein PC9H_002706 [Pleurotus ostreatus]|uniref:Uncharacterized protein n=1 Tax=Pleurotus ostreatus TaxID=5322 RepID=A0A8H6ZH95_PLEOS|nr:uncharacterized protein PC9H_002706 [Pleurotus ostreatus]KAF7416440.1 hypothetical protein PC9H_002706 [Pleurotus ostreatus]KAJ8689360.1 hypothetical protein PTI98_013385 [Pleurotus ostreatus]